MKKILFVLTIMFTMALSANAQFYAGGSLGLHADKNDFSLAISPEVGYTFQGNTGVGCLFDFTFKQDKASNFDKVGFGVNPYFEYRFLEIDKFTFYLHTYLHYNATMTDVPPTPSQNFDHSYGVSLHPGVIWGVTDHWSAAFYLGGIEYMWYQPAGVEFKNGSGDFNLGLSTSVPFAIALYYGF